MLTRPPIAVHVLLAAAWFPTGDAFYPHINHHKLEHLWTYEEFDKHHSHGYRPGHWYDESWSLWFDEDVNATEEELVEEELPGTNEMLAFRAKTEDEKWELYKEFIVTHTTKHEEYEREREKRRSTSYLVHHMVFRWRDGVVFSTLLMVKLLAVIAGCWCLYKHKRKRSYNDAPNSPFRRGIPKKVD